MRHGWQVCIPTAGPVAERSAQLKRCQPRAGEEAPPPTSCSARGPCLTLILLANTSTRGGLRICAPASFTAAKCLSSFAGFLCSAHTCTTCNKVTQSRWHRQVSDQRDCKGQQLSSEVV